MSLLVPKTPKEVKRSGYFFIFLIAVPPVFFISLLWRVYFSSAALVPTAFVSLIASVPLTVLLLARTKVLVARELLPQLDIGFRGYAVAWAAVVYLVYSWLVMAQASALALPSNRIQILGFPVTEKSECTVKCSCSTTVTVSNWPFSPMEKLCLPRDLWSTVNVGDHVLVEGIFSNEVIFVAGTHRDSKEAR